MVKVVTVLLLLLIAGLIDLIFWLCGWRGSTGGKTLHLVLGVTLGIIMAVVLVGPWTS